MRILAVLFEFDVASLERALMKSVQTAFHEEAGPEFQLRKLRQLLNGKVICNRCAGHYFTDFSSSLSKSGSAAFSDSAR